MTNYPDCIHEDSLEMGREYQDFVMEQLSKQMGLTLSYYTSRKYQYDKGECRQGFEIKLDKRCSESRRLSIEIAEKTQADNSEWSASGIYREDNTGFYLQGNYELAFIFLKHFLKQLHATRRYKEHEEPRGNPTIRAFYLPFADAEKYGLCLKFKKND